MKKKNLFILLASTAILVALAVILNSQRSAKNVESGEQALVLPELTDQVNTLDEISIISAGKEIRLKKIDGSWRDSGRFNYPADLSKIKSLLVGLTNIRFAEAKTAKPELYKELDVDDPITADAKAIGISLKDSAGKVVADIILGRKKPGNPASQYIRLSDQARSWLVKGQVQVETDASKWIDDLIIDIPKAQIKTAILDTKPAVKISRDAADVQEFSLLNIPKNKKAKAASTMNVLAEAMQTLRLEDVIPAEKFNLSSKAAASAQFLTFDGVKVTVKVSQEQNKWYAQLVADTDETAAEVVTRKNEINQRLSPWVYIIRDYRAENFSKTMADFTE